MEERLYGGNAAQQSLRRAALHGQTRPSGACASPRGQRSRATATPSVRIGRAVVAGVLIPLRLHGWLGRAGPLRLGREGRGRLRRHADCAKAERRCLGPRSEVVAHYQCGSPQGQEARTSCRAVKGGTL